MALAKQSGDRPAKSTRIHRIEQIRALASPVRQEIVDNVQACGPSTISEIAKGLGRPTENLYYHVSQLVKVELLSEVSKRATNGRPEALYDVPVGSLHVRYDPNDPENHAAVKELARSMLRVAGKDFADGFTPALATTEGADRNLWACRTKGWVRREDLEEINKLLHRLLELLRSQPSDGTLVALTWVLAPVAARDDPP